MKKTVFMMLLPLIMLTAAAQNNASPGKKFQMGAGVGVGVLTNEGTVINVSAEIQGEVKLSQGFSLFGMIAYNRLFGSGGSGGYASILAGPRAWFSPKFFIGVGGGIAFSAGGGESDAAFDYNPHIGLNTKKAQFTLGYNGVSEGGFNSGFIQLRAIAKF